MKSIKQIVTEAVVSEGEHMKFVRMCADWALYCEAISMFDKVKVLKLIKYLIEERTKSKRLLDRAISRFNRLNALKKEDLL